METDPYPAGTHRSPPILIEVNIGRGWAPVQYLL
ncbi:uncharacterized protein METZ01_LOCUS21228 [marine metagenome]|uniref:Uncharacterized protein n=1 Tax=marine metagenome TaxID=408172 RepID=A0A381PP40_9ZZZZ